MIGSRKGVIFTIMAIVVATVLFVTTMSVTPSRFDASANTDLIRVRVIDGVVNSFTNFAENALRSATYNALENMTAYLNSTTNATAIYFDDKVTFERNLSHCVLGRGSENRIVVRATPDAPCTGGKNLPSMLDNFSEIVLDALNVNVSYRLDADSLVVNEDLPLEAVVSFVVNVTVLDPIANWSIENLNITTVVPFTGLTDPAFDKFRGAGYLRNVPRRTFVRNPTKENEWNLNRIRDMASNGTYRWAKGHAPSVLMRYYGDFSSSQCCGIESFINISAFRLDLSDFNPSERYNLSGLDHELFASAESNFYVHKPFMCDGSGPQAYALLDYGALPYTDFRVNRSVLARYNVQSNQWNATCKD